jgi:hypothetical protein
VIASPANTPDFENPVDERPVGDAISMPGTGSVPMHLARNVKVS